MLKKSLIISLIIIIIYIWKDYKKIDFYYVNQNKITYDYSNLNNNFLKKVHKYLNERYEIFLVKNFDIHKNYWDLEDEKIRKSKKQTIYYENKKEFNTSLGKFKNNSSNWHRSHGNNTSNRFSSLSQINSLNAKNLKLAWIFKHDGFKSDIQANAIVNNGVIFTPISGGFIAAIKADTGKLIWKSKQFGYFSARRGLVYWHENKSLEPRLYFSNREKLICLNAITGEEINSFGGDGKIRTGLNVLTPVINNKNNEIIIATWDRSVEVYDLLSGKTKWKFKYYPKKDIRVGGKKYNNSGANPWGGISFDEKRQILFITTGNPHAYYDGTLRPGNNTGASSIIAIDIKNKKNLWTFQETLHDIWNSDLPAPPILTSIKINNNFVDVVVNPTKRANTLILDQVSGEPVFSYRYRKAPVSKIKGEKTSIYQPDLNIPIPFGKNIFEEKDFWSYDKNLLIEIKKKYENYNYGFYETHKLGEKNLQYNQSGGAEWMGASVDQTKQIMYVTSNNIPYETEIEIDNENSLIPTYTSFHERALDKNGFPISKPPWGTITAMDLNSGSIIWQIPFGEFKELSSIGVDITGTENFGGVTGTEGNVLFATGTLDKKFYVFNTKNRKQLFSYQLEYIGSSPPTTFSYNGKQYVIIHSTGGKTLGVGYPELVENGNLIYAFTLN